MVLSLLRARLRARRPVEVVLAAASAAATTGTGVAVVWALTAHGPVRGWSRAEILLCFGFAEICHGLFWFAFDGLQYLNRRYLLGGEIERLLARPADPWLLLLLDHLRPEALPVVAVGVSLVAWSGGWTAILVAPVFGVGGAALLGGFLTALAASGFWLGHGGTAIGLVWQLSAAGRYPPELLHPVLRLLATAVVPFAFTGWIPAAFCLGRIGGWAALQPFMGLGALLAGRAVFSVGLRRWRARGG
jgi:ABC-2 type transport system permease protein